MMITCDFYDHFAPDQWTCSQMVSNVCPSHKLFCPAPCTPGRTHVWRLISFEEATGPIVWKLKKQMVWKCPVRYWKNVVLLEENDSDYKYVFCLWNTTFWPSLLSASLIPQPTCSCKWRPDSCQLCNATAQCSSSRSHLTTITFSNYYPHL